MYTRRLKITYICVRSERILVIFDPENEGTSSVTPSPAAQNLCLQYVCHGEEGILGRKNASFLSRGRTQ